MKFTPSSPQLEAIQKIGLQLVHKKIPRYLFLVLCVNLIVAPGVQAATGNELSRLQAYALGILGLVTVAYSIYLFVVMFQPERF
ncbi:MAG: potassium-transporting ATPase subunit F [Acaryochloris sp. RU_4_1]|nr:potassium-transporting ATPase subunit F [Acaryochloris sp. RU_4_1]NJR56510.1 potassium-transporting ATPase subunit F [Acaryochloris sp. CRU_2_0]